MVDHWLVLESEAEEELRSSSHLVEELERAGMAASRYSPRERRLAADTALTQGRPTTGRSPSPRSYEMDSPAFSQQRGDGGRGELRLQPAVGSQQLNGRRPSPTSLLRNRPVSDQIDLAETDQRDEASYKLEERLRLAEERRCTLRDPTRPWREQSPSPTSSRGGSPPFRV